MKTVNKFLAVGTILALSSIPVKAQALSPQETGALFDVLFCVSESAAKPQSPIMEVLREKDKESFAVFLLRDNCMDQMNKATTASVLYGNRYGLSNTQLAEILTRVYINGAIAILD